MQGRPGEDGVRVEVIVSYCWKDNKLPRTLTPHTVLEDD